MDAFVMLLVVALAVYGGARLAGTLSHLMFGEDYR